MYINGQDGSAEILFTRDKFFDKGFINVIIYKIVVICVPRVIDL